MSYYYYYHYYNIANDNNYFICGSFSEINEE